MLRCDMHSAVDIDFDHSGKLVTKEKCILQGATSSKLRAYTVLT